MTGTGDGARPGAGPGHRPAHRPAGPPLLEGSTRGHNDTQATTGAVVTNVRMPSSDGLFLLDDARVQDPDLPVILSIGERDIPMPLRAHGNVGHVLWRP